MTAERNLWNEFRKVWPPERVKVMTLQEYTSCGNKDTFTYWIEKRLEKLGSIWGGSAFKFGIFSRNDKSLRENIGKRKYTENYGWLQKYGSSENEAFEKIRTNIIEVIVAIQNNDLERVNQVDLGSAYKWKIAFHYQNSIDKPVCIDIFNISMLEKISQCPPCTSRIVMYRKIIADWKGGDVLQYCVELWEKYSKDLSVNPIDIIIEEAEIEDDAKEINEHTEIQYLLLDLGSKMGLDVWAARNDRNKQFNGESFFSLKGILSDLPLQFAEQTNRTIKNIDVLWLKKNTIVAAFEIESTTSIYSGLLRMSDLVAMQPNINIPLFIVAPEERRKKVIAEVNRPSFNVLEPPLNDICRYISFKRLKEEFENIKKIIRFIKPEWLQDVSESCGPEEV